MELQAWPASAPLQRRYLLPGYFVLSWRAQINWRPVPACAEVVDLEAQVASCWAKLDHHFDPRTGGVGSTSFRGVDGISSGDTPRDKARLKLLGSTVLSLVQSEIEAAASIRLPAWSDPDVVEIQRELGEVLVRFHGALCDAYLGKKTKRVLRATDPINDASVGPMTPPPTVKRKSASSALQTSSRPHKSSRTEGGVSSLDMDG